MSVPGAGSIFHFHGAVHTSGKENAAFCCDVTNIEPSAAKRVGKWVPLGIRSLATDTALYYTSSVYSRREKKNKQAHKKCVIRCVALLPYVGFTAIPRVWFFIFFTTELTQQFLASYIDPLLLRTFQLLVGAWAAHVSLTPWPQVSFTYYRPLPIYFDRTRCAKRHLLLY